MLFTVRNSTTRNGKWDLMQIEHLTLVLSLGTGVTQSYSSWMPSGFAWTSVLHDVLYVVSYFCLGPIFPKIMFFFSTGMVLVGQKQTKLNQLQLPSQTKTSGPRTMPAIPLC